MTIFPLVCMEQGWLAHTHLSHAGRLSKHWHTTVNRCTKLLLNFEATLLNLKNENLWNTQVPHTNYSGSKVTAVWTYPLNMLILSTTSWFMSSAITSFNYQWSGLVFNAPAASQYKAVHSVWQHGLPANPACCQNLSPVQKLRFVSHFPWTLLGIWRHPERLSN